MDGYAGEFEEHIGAMERAIKHTYIEFIVAAIVIAIVSMILSKEVNKPVEELKKRQQETINAISALSKVLSKTAVGDLSARVDTKGWSEELQSIGMAINTLIESLEFEKKSKA